jgi:hypothetical protein
MVMIPMECPKCGRRGSVPSNRLNVGLNCKSCNAPFYLNAAGEARLGEPNLAKGESRRDQKTEKQGERESRFDVDFFASFKDMSSGDRIRKLAILAGLIVIVSSAYLYATMPTTDPLLERGKYVAKAFLDKAADRLRAVAYKDTGEDAVLWMEKGRARLGIKGTSSDFLLSVEVFTGGISEGGALVYASLVPLSPDAVGPPVEDVAKKGKKDEQTAPISASLLVPMNLVLGAERQWQLDGRQSLSTITVKH